MTTTTTTTILELSSVRLERAIIHYCHQRGYPAATVARYLDDAKQEAWLKILEPRQAPQCGPQTINQETLNRLGIQAVRRLVRGAAGTGLTASNYVLLRRRNSSSTIQKYIQQELRSCTKVQRAVFRCLWRRLDRRIRDGQPLKGLGSLSKEIVNQVRRRTACGQATVFRSWRAFKTEHADLFSVICSHKNTNRRSKAKLSKIDKSLLRDDTPGN